MFRSRLLTFLSAFLVTTSSLQAQQPANSFVVIEEGFNSPHLDAVWQNAEGWYSSGTSLTNKFVSKADASAKRIAHDLKDCRNSRTGGHKTEGLQTGLQQPGGPTRGPAD